MWRASLCALLVGLCAASSSNAAVLLDDSYEDELFLYDPNAPGIEVPNLPDETIFWAGRPSEATELNGAEAARYFMNSSSQKGWWNFATTASPAYLDNGESLLVQIDYIPRGSFSANTSRNWRFGLFYDPTNPIVEVHTNSDSGGTGNPFTDTIGYSTFINMTGADGNVNSNTVQQAGKRTNQTNTSLLGTGAGVHTLINGGSEIVHNGNNEYTLEMLVTRVSDALTTFTVSIYDKTGGDVVLSTQTVNDNGVDLGAGAAVRQFSFIGFRDSGTGSSFSAFDFTRVYVEHLQIPEPATLVLGGLLAPLALLRRKR